MYRNLTFGNSSGSYNVKDLNTALAREEAAACSIFTVKDLKRSGSLQERGYDYQLVGGGNKLINLRHGNT